MVGMFFSILSMVVALLFVLKIRNRKVVTYEIMHGKMCYKCKCDIDSVRESYDYGSYSKNALLCKSCDRDNKLSSVIDNKWYDFFGKPIFFGRDYSKISIALNFLSILLNGMSFFYKPLATYGGIFLFLGMSFLYINFISITKKKL